MIKTKKPDAVERIGFQSALGDLLGQFSFINGVAGNSLLL
jgi:hypothetical protein